jgi:hypothetical protein
MKTRFRHGFTVEVLGVVAIALAGVVVACNHKTADAEHVGVKGQSIIYDNFPPGPQCDAAPRNEQCQRESQAAFLTLKLMQNFNAEQDAGVDVSKIPNANSLAQLLQHSHCITRIGPGGRSVGAAIAAAGVESRAGNLTFNPDPWTGTYACNGVKFYPIWSSVTSGKQALLNIALAVQDATLDSDAPDAGGGPGGGSLWMMAHNFRPPPPSGYSVPGSTRPSFDIAAYPAGVDVTLLVDPTDVNTTGDLANTNSASAAGDLVYSTGPDTAQVTPYVRRNTVSWNTFGSLNGQVTGDFCYYGPGTDPSDPNAVVTAGTTVHVGSVIVKGNPATQWMCGFE